MYISVANVPYIFPSTYPESAMANVWSVNGTPHGVGIVMIERTDVIAANIPTKQIVRIDIFLFIISPSAAAKN